MRRWFETLLAILFAAGAILSVCYVLVHRGPEGRRNLTDEAQILTGGDIRRGAQAIAQAGCGACHDIPHIDRANGRVGPSLRGFAVRNYIAGMLPNTPDNLVRWLQHPREVNPKTAMPDLGLDAQTARDIAAFLYANEDQP